MTLALELIDAFLADTKGQSLIDADRVRNLLLDLRLVLSSPVPSPVCPVD